MWLMYQPLTVAEMKQVLEAKERAKKELAKISAISGIGIARTEDGGPCVRVNVDENISNEELEQIPSLFGEVLVQVKKIGAIQTVEQPAPKCDCEKNFKYGGKMIMDSCPKHGKSVEADAG
jgi:hypothetical protein